MFCQSRRRRLPLPLRLAIAVMASWLMPAAGAAPCGAVGEGTVLARAAAGLAPGQWCDFDAAERPELAERLAVAPGDENNYVNWQHGAQWDPVNRLWLFHGYDYAPVSAAMVVYAETENRWHVARDQPFAAGGNGHDYDQTVVDPETGMAYYRPRLSNTVWRGTWDPVAGRHLWDERAVARLGGGCPSQKSLEANGMAWDGSRRGIVLFSAAAGGVVCFWDRARNRWHIDARIEISGRYHQVVEWDPVHGASWLTDYLSASHWKNVHGRVTQLASRPPFTLGCCGSSGADITVDPASGSFIVTREVEGRRLWYEFNLVRDRWTPIDWSMPPLGDNVSSLGGAVDSHGVIMYLRASDGGPQLYLYRHKR